MTPPFGRRGQSEARSDRVVKLPPRHGGSGESGVVPNPAREALLGKVKQAARERIDAGARRNTPRAELSKLVGGIVAEHAKADKVDLNRMQLRNMVSAVLNEILGSGQQAPEAQTPVPPRQGAVAKDLPPTQVLTASPKEVPTKIRTEGAGRRPGADQAADTSFASVAGAKERIQGVLMERIDVGAASDLPRDELAQQIAEVVREILGELKIQLNQGEQRDLVTMLLNDMLGLGPLEPLLADEAITDIMVNGPKQIYIERHGKLELTDVTFRDNAQVMNVATRIVTRIGRRVDESSPLVDARLEDGSRVNIIAPPLAIDGAAISIRKFAKQKLTLDSYERNNNLSPEMATVLRIAARSRCNILISGGTGSGKTTLLNALSQMVETGERIVTIEDAAELQLQQPHVVRLETRPPNLEGQGEITMRDLVKNALRMRPDRIILGEVRGGEALDMLQAMNTGHEGSMGTIHANSPREGLTRLENMIGMAGVNLPPKAVRTQVSDAVDMIVQVSRMRDGARRVVSITEVIGMEGDIITTQELFSFQYEGEDTDGNLLGRFECAGLRPYFTPKAEYFGLQQALLEAI